MPSARQQLSQREIDAVLARYDIGAVSAISELAAGSVYSPKVIVESARGRLLLKRRARGLDIPALVAFSHEVQLACQQRGLCVPPLLGDRDEHNSMTQFEDQVYELFAYIDGRPFDRANPAHARQSGALLAELHRELDTVRTRFEPAVETATIDTQRLTMLAPRREGFADRLVEDLTRLMGYGEELARSNAARPALVHGDWHPGNLIYQGDELVAVCDFDNTRVGSRAREVTQAMVHISLIAPRPGQSPAQLAPEPDPGPLRLFWEGYAGSGGPCDARLCLGLMPAVIIDEALATLGQLDAGAGGDPAATLLTAVWRKAVWIDEHQGALRELLAL